MNFHLNHFPKYSSGQQICLCGVAISTAHPQDGFSVSQVCTMCQGIPHLLMNSASAFLRLPTKVTGLKTPPVRAFAGLIHFTLCFWGALRGEGLWTQLGASGPLLHPLIWRPCWLGWVDVWPLFSLRYPTRVCAHTGRFL